MPVLKISHALSNLTHPNTSQYFNCELQSILQCIVLTYLPSLLQYFLMIVRPSTASPLQLTKVTAGQSLQLSLLYCFEMTAVKRKLALHLLSLFCCWQTTLTVVNLWNLLPHRNPVLTLESRWRVVGFPDIYTLYA